jgi:Ca2+-binding RTX toxin-like protein
MGTAANDVILPGYMDADGDLVDGNDAILPGEFGDDDIIYAGAGNDFVRGGNGDDEIYGGDGDDAIYGGDGNDQIWGEKGSDALFGEAGNDTIYGGSGWEKLDGGEGDDTLYGEGGNDTILGGNGNDYADGGDGDDYIDTSAPVSSVPLPDRGYPGLYPSDSDPFNDRDTVFGGAGNDTIFTGDDNDIIDGGAGNDTIDGGFDDDTIDGGDGNDFIVGGEGSDTIRGGADNDTIYGGLNPSFPDAVNIPDEGPGGPDLVPDNGKDLIYGGDGDDTIFGQDDDDTIYGDAGNDVIDAGIDDDTVYGGTGNDTITGGQGKDTLFGGDDRDTFLGGNAGDVVDGGSGGDDFDTLDLTGSGPLNVIYTSADKEDGYVIFNGDPTQRLDFTEIENVIPCFTPGTRVATPRGEVAVEDLKVGDKVITRDNGFQDIQWVGHKRITLKTLTDAPHLKPVLIKAGSLGNGLPERDMIVSPNHRMLIANAEVDLLFDQPEVLVAAKHLVGMDGVHRLDMVATTYIHFMCASHQIVLADGAWSESFQPGDYTLSGIDSDQRDEIFELFPELKTRIGRENYISARPTLKKFEAKLVV